MFSSFNCNSKVIIVRSLVYSFRTLDYRETIRESDKLAKIVGFHLVRIKIYLKDGALVTALTK